MRGRHLAAAALVVGLLAAACSSNDSGSTDSGGTGSGGSGSGTSVTIKDFAFNPNELTGGAGQTLEIAVSNQDDVEHSFTLDDGSVSEDLEGGDSKTIEVALPDSGTMGWHCKYHPSMTGTITVG